MKKIDRETTQRILDAADIVEVVSDFVSLKRRGANYIGLCPFHNERTPSFSVSRARNYCKCFSCGKGGSPVNFLIELEGMSYQDALRWLARKYNIEIKEHDLSEKEIQDAAERESLLAVNDFAMKFFEDYMAQTQEGRDIGLAYFRERGINDVSIRKFHLGFGPEQSDRLYRSALSKGYEEQYLTKSGLCQRNERGVYDRFRARVIYPVFSLSGRVVAFGGRTLRTDKSVAKYVNSPESVIYSKSRELYGLYQARQAINREDKCILVEGYMDVISMHQSGVENVVASSGTSLTEQQILLIRRFTRNVTVIYDSDAAGIKASMRGIDMLLAQGMNIKVLSLPDGEDPDSYAQSHSTEELKAYIREHEVDFIRFKMDILLKDVKDDPLKRANAIASIVKSVSVIPDQLIRNVYLEECSRVMEISETVLSKQLAVYMAANEEEREKKRLLENRAKTLEPDTALTQKEPHQGTDTVPKESGPSATADNAVIRDISERMSRQGADKGTADSREAEKRNILGKFEREILRYAQRYGVMHLCDVITADNQTMPMTVLEYIVNELSADGITFVNSANEILLSRIREVVSSKWTDAYDEEVKRVDELRNLELKDGFEVIRKEAKNMSEIQARERSLNEELDVRRQERLTDFARHFVERILCSDSDDDVRRLATELADDKYVLSKIHSKYSHFETEQERLRDLVPRSVYELKNAILECKIADVQAELRDVASAGGDVCPVIKRLNELKNLQKDFARFLGERIITPGAK